MYCIKCGSEIAEDAVYCRFCGCPVPLADFLGAGAGKDSGNDRSKAPSTVSTADDIVFLSPLKKGQKAVFYIVEKKDCIYGFPPHKEKETEDPGNWWHIPGDIIHKI